jgi:hypothetical protein
MTDCWLESVKGATLAHPVFRFRFSVLSQYVALHEDISVSDESAVSNFMTEVIMVSQRSCDPEDGEASSFKMLISTGKTVSQYNRPQNVLNEMQYDINKN